MSETSESSPGNKKTSFFRFYAVVISAFIAMMAMGTLLFSFGVFFKTVSAEFGWTRAETSGAFSLAMILSGLLGIIAGRLGDRFKPDLVIIVCGVVEGLACLLLSQLHALWQLYFYYGILVGIGMANLPPIISLVTRSYTKRRAMMMGVAIAGSGTGAAIASPAATYAISVYGWQISYLILGGVILVLIAIMTAFLLKFGASRQSGSVRNQVADKLSGVPRGLSLKEAAGTLPFWILGAIIFCTGYTQQTMAVHLVPGATDMGISAANAAGILSVINLATLTGALSSGVIVDKAGGWSALVISLVLTLVAFILLLGFRELWAFYLFAAIFGLSWGIVAISRSIVIVNLFGLHSNGSVTGAILFCYTIGGTLGPVIAGHIFDLSHSYELAFVVTASLCIVSLAMCLPLRVPAGRFR